jgi:hypothetical protein
VLHILEIPRNLRRPVAHEKEATTRFFDREIARVEYVLSTQAARGEEKAKLAAAAAAAKAAGAPKELSKKELEKLDAEEETQYRALEREFKIALGIIGENDPDA